MDSLYNTLISLLGGGVSGWFISAHQKRLDKRDEEERRKSAELISALQEKRLKEIEESQKKMQSDFDTHLQADKSQEILNELKHLRDSNLTLNGVMTRIDDSLDRISTTVAEQKAKIENHELYLRNLNEIVTGHLNNHK